METCSQCQAEFSSGKESECGVVLHSLWPVEWWSPEMITIYSEPMNMKGGFKAVGWVSLRFPKEPGAVNTLLFAHWGPFGLPTSRPWKLFQIILSGDLYGGYSRHSIHVRLSYTRGFLGSGPGGSILKWTSLAFLEARSATALTYPVGNGHTGNQRLKTCTSC